MVALFLTKGRVCRLPVSQSVVVSLLPVCTIYTLYVIKCIQYIKGLLLVQDQYRRSCSIISSSCYVSLVTLTVVCLTATKIKPLIFPVSGFALFNVVNICILLFCMVSACCLNTTELIVPTVFIITSRHAPHTKHSFFIVACVFIAAGSFLPSRCPETIAVYSPYLAVVA
jgi:hypothetical protein